MIITFSGKSEIVELYLRIGAWTWIKNWNKVPFIKRVLDSTTVVMGMNSHNDHLLNILHLRR